MTYDAVPGLVETREAYGETTVVVERAIRDHNEISLQMRGR